MTTVCMIYMDVANFPREIVMAAVFIRIIFVNRALFFAVRANRFVVLIDVVIIKSITTIIATIVIGHVVTISFVMIVISPANMTNFLAVMMN